jgi:mediator of RNA polymerase II transcription subunit 17
MNCERGLLLKRFMLTISRLARKEIPATRLGENLRRIFQERGTDFFKKNKNPVQREFAESEDKQLHLEASNTAENEQSVETKNLPEVMTVEELFAMRSEILPQLLYVLVSLDCAQ